MITNILDNRQIKVIITYSPILELILSFHVMSNPNHHINCKTWVEHRYQECSEEMQQEIISISRKYADWFFIEDIFLFIIEKNMPKMLTVEEALDEFYKMEKQQFVYLFLGLPAFEFDKNVVQQWIDNPEALTPSDLREQADFFAIEDVRYFLKRIDEVRVNIARLIREYWTRVFSKYWASIESYLSDIAKKEQLTFETTNILSYLDSIHPDIKIEERLLVFRKDPVFSIPIAKIRQFVISLTVFNSPHLNANIVGDTVFVCKNLNFHSVKLNEDLFKPTFDLLCSVSDPTRLRIMKILWNGDSTTKELADVLGLTASTISLHLKILKEANLVETSKVKKFVYYRLIKDPFYTLQKDLTDYFEY